MRIEEATYGVTSTGHGLLEFSGEGASSARELAWRMDLPGAAPAGVSWSPYISGFSAPPYYVLSYTAPDTGAKRAGMVATRAIFAPASEIALCDDLSRLISIVIDRAKSRKPVTGFEFECDEPVKLDLPEPVRGALCESFLAAGGKPLICLDESRFPSLVACIWNRLWPAARAAFSFRLSFSAQDVAGLSLACTPVALRARWFQHPLFDAHAPAASVSPAAELFAGLSSAKEIESFASELGHAPTDLSDFRLLTDAHKHWLASSFDALVAAARLFARLSPDPAAGREIKRELISRLAINVGHATPNDLLKLANVELSEIADDQRVWEAVELWANNFFDQPIEPLDRLLAAAEDGRSSQGWAQAIWRGISTAVRSNGDRAAEAVWKLWGHDQSLVRLLFSHLASGVRFQEALVANAPKSLAGPIADEVLTRAAERKWWSLHGVAAAASLPALEAISLQLKADSTGDAAGLRRAASRATSQELVQAALRADSVCLFEMAGGAAASEPRLLRRLQVSDERWRAVWLAALKLEPSTWEAPEDPRAAMYALLDRQIDAGDVDDAILAALSASPLANLIDYPRRDEVWGVIEPSAREQLLRATASAWLARAVQADQVEAPEAPLSSAIVASAELVAIEADEAASVVLRIYDAMPELGEERFQRWLNAQINRSGALSTDEATKAGDLVRRRGWSSTARSLLPASHGHMPSYVETMLMHVVDLIDLGTRYSFNLWFGGAPKPAEKWQVLEDVAAELYPRGPQEYDLWRRSGGSNADLPHAWSGREIWREALRIVRHGGGRVRVWELIRRMREDWPNNHSLWRLAQEPEFAPPPPPQPRPKKGRR